MASQNPTRGTRFPDETEEDFVAYRDKNDMNNSEALRELVRTGLAEKRSGPLDDRPDGHIAGLFWRARRDIHTFVLVAVVSLLVSTLTASAVLSLAAQALALGYALVVLLVAIDTVLLRDRLTLRLIDLSDRVTVEVDR